MHHFLRIECRFFNIYVQSHCSRKVHEQVPADRNYTIFRSCCLLLVFIKVAVDLFFAGVHLPPYFSTFRTNNDLRASKASRDIEFLVHARS